MRVTWGAFAFYGLLMSHDSSETNTVGVRYLTLYALVHVPKHTLEYFPVMSQRTISTSKRAFYFDRTFVHPARFVTGSHWLYLYRTHARSTPGQSKRLRDWA